MNIQSFMQGELEILTRAMIKQLAFKGESISTFTCCQSMESGVALILVTKEIADEIKKHLGTIHTIGKDSFAIKRPPE